MSQTWVIKDTAPVDRTTSLYLVSNISFTSNNEQFSQIMIANNGEDLVMMGYSKIDGTAVSVASVWYNIGETAFKWNNNAYKTIIFDTAPTGELLAWLQKNADLIGGEGDHRYQDLHLSDVDLNTQFKQYMAAGQYEAALAILQNDQLTDKMVVAALFNYVTSRIVEVQSMSDPTFKQDVIRVATQPPAGMTSGQVYFKLKE